MYSIVIKIAIEVNKAVKGFNDIPMLGSVNELVEVPIADPDPNKSSVTVTFILSI